MNGAVVMNTVIWLITALLCIIGAVAIIKWCALKVASGSDGGKRVYLVLLKGENAEEMLQIGGRSYTLMANPVYAIETLEWDAALDGAAAYAVDCGLLPSQRDACAEICENGRIRLIDKGQLDTIML